MINEPKISIILATHNRSQIITKAIRSVLNQSYNNFELIIIDDGSTDDTKIKISRIKDRRIIYLRQGHSANPAAIRNKALKTASGAYLAFIDDDCNYSNKHLQILSGYLNKNWNIGLVYSDISTFTPDGKQFTISNEFNKTSLECAPFFSLPTVMLRRECLEKIGLFDERLRYGSDWDLWLRITDHFDAHHIAMTTVKHFYFDNIKTVSGMKNKIRPIEIIIKKRVNTAMSSGRIINYINTCSIPIIKNLINYGDMRLSCRLRDSFVKIINNYQTLACQALCYFSKGQYQKALICFTNALKNKSGLDTGEPWQKENIRIIKLFLAKIYFNLDKLDLAKNILNEILRANPYDLDSRIELAKYYLKKCQLNDLAKLLKYPRKIKGIYNPGYNNIKGCYYFKIGKFKKAEREMLNAITLDPNTPIYRHNLKTIKRYLGNNP